MDQSRTRKKKRYKFSFLFFYFLLGGGRKIRDPEMEKTLFSWYTNLKNNSIPVTPKMIKQRALQITKFNDFIASKGWLEKFKKKFKLELSRENKIETQKNSLPSTVSTTSTLPTQNKNLSIPIKTMNTFISITTPKEIKPQPSQNETQKMILKPRLPFKAIEKMVCFSPSNCPTNSNTPAIK